MKDITERDMENNIPLASKKHEGHKTTIKVGSCEIGGDKFTVIAGPCTIESLDQILDIAKHVKEAGADMLRGGAFKPLTFPYRSDKVFELGVEGLKMLREAGDKYDIPVVTEVTDVRLVDTVAEYADMLHIGARNMQNFILLEEVGKSGKPVLLKRHFGASLRDWLAAAEYLLYNGNENVLLCERGIVAPHTHEPTSRFIVDIQVVPAVREYSHLPIVVDPSHATFKRKYVPAISRAAVAVGADGVMLEVHPTPDEAAIDPLQAINYETFNHIMKDLRAIANALGQSL